MVRSQPPHPVAAPYPKPLETIGQAPNPAGQLRIGERAIAGHQRQLIRGDPGSALNPGADSEVGPSGRHRSHGQGYPQPTPRRQEATPATHPEREALPLATGYSRTSKRTRTVMQLSVLIPGLRRSPRFGHVPDHLTAARPAPNAKMTSVRAGHRLVEAPAGIEPATPSLPWNHREPLCRSPFSQVVCDRRTQSYRF